MMLGKMIFDRRPHFVGHQISGRIFPFLASLIENDVKNNDNVRNREQLMSVCCLDVACPPHTCLIYFALMRIGHLAQSNDGEVWDSLEVNIVEHFRSWAFQLQVLIMRTG